MGQDQQQDPMNRETEQLIQDFNTAMPIAKKAVDEVFATENMGVMLMSLGILAYRSYQELKDILSEADVLNSVCLGFDLCKELERQNQQRGEQDVENKEVQEQV